MSNKQDTVAFLILCWNNKDIIDECLQAIRAQTYPNIEVYIIDNNSSDGSAAYIRKNYPEIHLTASKSNNGFAKGNNILVEKALKNPRIGYLALVNTDAMIAPNWAKTLVEFAKTKPKAACLQGLTLDYYNHNKVDSHHIYVRKDLQSVQYDYGKPNRHQFYHTTKVFGVNAASALYTRAFVESQQDSKLFDERFFMYLEDVDVSFRALVSGWENYFVQGAETYHMGSASAKKRSSDYSVYMSFRNQAALLYKNMPFKVFWMCLPAAARFEWVFYIHTFKKHGIKTLMKVIQGRVAGILRLTIYWSDRRLIKRHRKISSDYLFNLIQHDGQYK